MKNGEPMTTSEVVIKKKQTNTNSLITRNINS